MMLIKLLKHTNNTDHIQIFNIIVVLSIINRIYIRNKKNNKLSICPIDPAR